MSVPLPLRLAGYRVAHATGRLQQLPINLTISVTYRCSSRCVTCNIWRKRVKNLTLDEYERTFHSLEGAPLWVTLSGGDQFVRADFDEIVRLVKDIIRPRVINIPMNGLVTGRIFKMLPRIAAYSAGAQLVLNLSIDEIGQAHDQIRGAPGAYAKQLEVAELVRDLKRTYSHVVLGVHTVVSRANANRIEAIEDEVRRTFHPDSYITEVAERRVELDTSDIDITPGPSEYRAVVAGLKRGIRRNRSWHPIGRLTESLRLEYYDLAARVLEERRQVIDCYAGWASAQLSPDGDVWGCCTRAESLGNVRDYGYDFRTIWLGPAAAAFRDSVRRKECACPLANASYTNMMLSAPSLVKVARNLVGVGGAGGSLGQ